MGAETPCWQWMPAPTPIIYYIGGHDNAMAPAIYLNKQIDKVAPHKKQKRGKFKRSSKG